MYKILCYGDSNTWGCKPGTQKRHEREKRWAGVMENELRDDYQVVEEGLNGRTTVWEDPIEGYKSGKNYLLPCLETHKPIDMVIIMLGTNDLKARFSVTAYDVAEGAGTLVDVVSKSEAGKDEGAPETLLIVPPPIAELTEYKDPFRGAREKSRKLSEEFKRVSTEHECHLLDAGEHINSSSKDGVHLEPSEHRKLGQVVADKLVELRS
ncbi:MAG: SGNH/GDSL hydrolase family protein [Candidatus Bipolaricaulota bacterium]|nr:SGNH/GDSL hydrolase family protein [Candidatus Bipolaricaulota bacterium]